MDFKSMSKETIITAIGSLIAFVLVVLNKFIGMNIQLDPEMISSIASSIFIGVMLIISFVRNHDTNKVSSFFTPVMRKVKELYLNGDVERAYEIMQAVEQIMVDDANRDSVLEVNQQFEKVLIGVDYDDSEKGDE